LLVIPSPLHVQLSLANLILLYAYKWIYAKLSFVETSEAELRVPNNVAIFGVIAE
jgi:hypothetical protein